MHGEGRKNRLDTRPTEKKKRNDVYLSLRQRVGVVKGAHINFHIARASYSVVKFHALQLHHQSALRLKKCLQARVSLTLA